MAGLGLRSHHVPDRVRQSHHRHVPVGMDVHRIPSRDAFDYAEGKSRHASHKTEDAHMIWVMILIMFGALLTIPIGLPGLWIMIGVVAVGGGGKQTGLAGVPSR